MKKIMTILLLTQLSACVSAQKTPAYAVSLNHVALSVKDVNRSAEFYMNILNLKEIVNRTEVDGIRWFSLGEGKELHLISTLKSSVTVNKAVHFALTTSNFDAFINQLTAMQVTYSDWPGTRNKISVRADGIRQVFIQDPDGYWIEVNSVGQKNK